MIRVFRPFLCAALVAVTALPAGAFALLGPFKDQAFPGQAWQGVPYNGLPRGLGYVLAGDIAGPMFAHEAYRFNVPVLTYGFDASFIRYFGPKGIEAVEKAFAILNALPPASQMSPTLDEFPLDVKGQNAEAAALGLVDVKSTTLNVMMEALGLANPERFVFGLRNRIPPPIDIYTVIQMNYDPQTIQPSRYVNGVLYNFQVVDPIGPPGGEWASAVEWYTLDPLRIPYSSVAGGFGSGDLIFGELPGADGTLQAFLLAGQYYDGLTRDDVGGLRYLLSTNNFVYEDLLPTVIPNAATQLTSPWNPIFVTNLVNATNIAITNLLGTNPLGNFVINGLRPGVDKITYHRVNFDSLIGNTFTPITNRYTDTFINATNGRVLRQKVARVILAPDILFSARDIGAGILPFSISRDISFVNHAADNTSQGLFPLGLGGPGVIVPGTEITFNDLWAYWISFNGGTDADSPPPTTWASFDGSDTPPVIYPIFQHPITPELSLDYLRALFARRRN